MILGAWLLVYYLAHVSEHKTQEDEPNVGLVVPILNILAYVLGAVSLAHEPWVAVTMTVAPVLLLTGREQLHALARRVEIKEIVTAGEFLILTGVVLPLLPNHPVSDLTAITPRQVWLALVVVCSFSYASYLAQRYWAAGRQRFVDGGARRHVFLDRNDRRAGAAGQGRSGAQAPGAGRDHARHRDHVSAAARGGADLQPRSGARSGAAAVRARARGLRHLRAAILARQTGRRIGSAHGDAGGADMAIRWSSARRRSLPRLFVVVSIVSTVAKSQFGVSGIYGLAAIVGVTDIDPFVLNLAQGGISGVQTTALAAAILIAASSNNVLKALYAAFFAGGRSTVPSAIALVVLALAGLGAAYATAVLVH